MEDEVLLPFYFFSCQFAKSYLCHSSNLGHDLLDNVQALKQERNIFSFMEQPKSYYQDRSDHIFEGWLYPSHYRWPMLNYLPLQQPSVSTFYSDELVKASGSLSSPGNQMRGSKKIRILPWTSGWSWILKFHCTCLCPSRQPLVSAASLPQRHQRSTP